MTRLVGLLAVLAAALAVTMPSFGQPGDAAMNRCLTGCRAWWVVYASIPGGETWWFQNKNGDVPAGEAADARAKGVQQALTACHIRSVISLSDWFDAFTADLVVVHSDPYASRRAAQAELAKAKACGITGYVKFSPFRFTGRD